VALLASQFFGKGSRPYMLSQVNCSGLEETLAECQSRGVNVHDCRSLQEAGVKCGENCYLTYRIWHGKLVWFHVGRCGIYL